MTYQVYAVEGNMEDWRYAAGWENQLNPIQKTIKTWSTHTFNQYSIDKTSYKDFLIRLMMFLVQTQYNKRPNENELSNSDHILENDKFTGHIPRNICLAVDRVYMDRPYVLLTFKNNETIFYIIGCISELWFKIVTLKFKKIDI